jgi:N,N'-diacetyllegionaminate synthase
MNIHVIAEAGTNHNGNPQKAKNLIDIAKRAGADSVKFQIINTWGLYLPGNYEYGHYKIEDVIKIRQDGEMSDAEYKMLADYGREKGIPFSSSVFDPDGLKLLASFKPPYIKIASCDLNNVRFLKQVASFGIKMVISTGMSTLDDVRKTVKTITSTGFKDIVLLHCVSVYPAKLEQGNLRFITTLKNEFGFEVGFSDHTPTSHAACMALTLGATWFEKHFTEDKTQKGLDHAYAMEEEGLKSYVDDLKAAAIALTPREDKISDKEFYTRKRARRSLYAAHDLQPGHIVTDDDVLCVRPENVMQADEIDLVVGKSLSKAIKQYQPFTPELLK